MPTLAVHRVHKYQDTFFITLVFQLTLGLAPSSHSPDRSYHQGQNCARSGPHPCQIRARTVPELAADWESTVPSLEPSRTSVIEVRVRDMLHANVLHIY